MILFKTLMAFLLISAPSLAGEVLVCPNLFRSHPSPEVLLKSLKQYGNSSVVTSRQIGFLNDKLNLLTTASPNLESFIKVLTSESADYSITKDAQWFLSYSIRVALLHSIKLQADPFNIYFKASDFEAKDFSSLEAALTKIHKIRPATESELRLHHHLINPEDGNRIYGVEPLIFIEGFDGYQRIKAFNNKYWLNQMKFSHDQQSGLNPVQAILKSLLTLQNVQTKSLIGYNDIELETLTNYYHEKVDRAQDLNERRNISDYYFYLLKNQNIMQDILRLTRSNDYNNFKEQVSYLITKSYLDYVARNSSDGTLLEYHFSLRDDYIKFNLGLMHALKNKPSVLQNILNKIMRK